MVVVKDAYLSVQFILNQCYDSTNKRLKTSISDYLAISNDGTKTTLLGLAGDYLRIGDAGVTSHSLDSEDDVLITGEAEFDGRVFIDHSLWLGMTVPLSFDGGSSNFRMNITDTDARAHQLSMYAAGNYVPILVLTDDGNYASDLGFFAARYIPSIALVAADGGGHFTLGCDDTDILDILATTAPVVDVDETKFSHKLQCVINGTTYYVMLTQT